MVKSYRPRLSANDVVVLMYLIREKRQILRYKYKTTEPEKQWAISLWKAEYKRLFPLLRKFERLDPLNYGYNERWKHKRVPKEVARQRMAEDIAKMREEQAREDIKIKHCFWFKNGKCLSPELYRFHPESEKTGDCPFSFEQTAFTGDGRLRCLEFRHEH